MVSATSKAEEKTKAEIELEIERGIDEFLKNGGEIEYVKSNKSQQKGIYDSLHST